MTYLIKQRTFTRNRYRGAGINLATIGIIILGLLLISTPATAQRVEPMSYEMTPSGSGVTKALRIENTSQRSITVELTANKISVDDYGHETKTPAEDDFLIFPPQAIIKPGKTQTVRVKYIGDPKIKKSAAYRISVGQLPIDLGERTGGAVGFVINFHTLATIAPKDSIAQLHMSSIKRGADGHWDIAIENTGNRMGRLSRSIWKVSDASGKRKVLAEQEVSQMTDKNLVMPGATLKLSIPALEGFNPDTTSVDITVRS